MLRVCGLPCAVAMCPHLMLHPLSGTVPGSIEPHPKCTSAGFAPAAQAHQRAAGTSRRRHQKPMGGVRGKPASH